MQTDKIKSYSDAGLNILPAKLAQKSPTVPWRTYQNELFKGFDAFDYSDALCVVCGSISGNLEILDFDCRGLLFSAFAERIKDFGKDFLIERSPSGGYHLAYRVAGPVDGNRKLATLEVGCEGSEVVYCGKTYKSINGYFYPCAIETRGEGGICLIDPSPGYIALSGDWTKLPVLTLEERNEIIETARSFNEKVEEEKPIVRPSVTQKTDSFYIGETVADKLRNEGAPRRLLEENGWIFVFETDEFEQWRRPGKLLGVSGSLFKGTLLFKCFSSNAAPLEEGRTYTPLQLYAAFNFNGNESDAARAVSRGEYLNEVLKSLSDEPKTVSFRQKTDEEKPEEKPEENKESEFPNEILDDLGFITDLSNYTLSSAVRRQPILAFAGAFTALSYMIGRRVITNYGNLKVYPNVYVIGLGGSGTGKNAARMTNKLLQNIYDDSFQTPERFESKQAFADFLTAKNQILYQCDEFGSYLRAITGEHANNCQKELIAEWLILFSSAGDRNYVSRIRAADPSPRVVRFPHFSLYATTNHDEFFKSAKLGLMRNGFLPRCFLLSAEKYVKKDFNEIYFSSPSGAFDELPHNIVAIINAWREYRKPDPVGACEPSPVQVPLTASAKKLFFEFERDFVEPIYKKESLSDGASDYLARISEKLYKAALIFSASIQGPSEGLKIDSRAAELAIKLEEYDVKQILNWRETKFSENEFDAESKQIKNWFLKQKKIVSHVDFSKRFTHLKNRKELIENLIDGGFLDVVFEDTKRGPKKRSYKIKRFNEDED